MMSIIYTTVPEKEAEKMAEALVARRLVACVVMLPAKSIYRWKGKLQRNKEIVILFKTTERNAQKAIEELLKIHPYEVPCIIKLSGSANSEYQKWLEEETRNR